MTSNVANIIMLIPVGSILSTVVKHRDASFVCEKRFSAIFTSAYKSYLSYHYPIGGGGGGGVCVCVCVCVCI